MPSLHIDRKTFSWCQGVDIGREFIRYEYDALGRKTREIDALGNAVSYTYDSRGNIISKTDALGRVTSFEYDPLNRVRAQIEPLGGRIEYTPVSKSATTSQMKAEKLEKKPGKESPAKKVAKQCVATARMRLTALVMLPDVSAFA